MKTLVLILSAALCFSCASTVSVTKAEGDYAFLKHASGKKYRVELLAADEIALYFKLRWPDAPASPKDKLYKINYSETKSIDVRFYSLFSEKVASAVTILLLDGLTIGLFHEEWGEGDADFFLASAAISIPLTLVASFTGNPKTSFSPPVEPRYLDKLKLYCRYPQNLTVEQWQQLLREYGQEDFLSLAQ
jgi:hypothetical protein